MGVLERVTGIEPASPPWKGGIIAVIPHPHVLHSVSDYNLKKVKSQYLKNSQLGVFLLRGQDLNLRPPGYGPDELPDCSTPRYNTNCI
jgi:hypothetical protein